MLHSVSDTASSSLVRVVIVRIYFTISFIHYF